MAYDDNDRSPWGRVIVILIGLFVAFLLVGLVLKIVKWAIYAALLAAAFIVLTRASRGGRR
jgi:hypothetical protein